MSDSNTQSDQQVQSQPSAIRRMLRVSSVVGGYLLPPVLLFAAGVGVLAVLGAAQHYGYLKPAESARMVASSGPAVDYICPMMCVPPTKEPGRCPVCAMELVPSTAGSGSTDGRSIVVDAASRRIANISTVSARSVTLKRTIRSVGELQYNEGALKTIAAYSAGRFEKLYIDHTGARVKKGQAVASFYSPELYSAQIEYLQSMKSSAKTGRVLASIAKANERLKQNARQRLIELGMQPRQLSELDRDRQPQSRMDVTAPMSGTVIQRMIAEGDYVKEGQPILKLADLSSVWLMLELFPEDAAAVRYGQAVSATVESLPGEVLHGRVAFIDPDVDAKSRTVSVRVVVPNPDGRLRIGEFATAEIEVLSTASGARFAIYDPELSNKWISPRHPHVVSDSPGNCRVCGVELVHASTLGFRNEPADSQSQVVVVPSDAILQAAKHSLVYVESEAGKFEIRRVRTGPTTDEGTVIFEGIAAGETVATRGNFLIDSQMQLSGNPSLIDPMRAAPPMKIIPGFTPEMLVEIRKLPKDLAARAIEQAFCPIAESRLGSMGVPIEIKVDGKSVFACCKGCRETWVNEPAKSFRRLAELQAEAKLAAKATENNAHVAPIGETEAWDSLPIGEESADSPPVGDIELLPPTGGNE